MAKSKLFAILTCLLAAGAGFVGLVLLSGRAPSGGGGKAQFASQLLVWGSLMAVGAVSVVLLVRLGELARAHKGVLNQLERKLSSIKSELGVLNVRHQVMTTEQRRNDRVFRHAALTMHPYRSAAQGRARVLLVSSNGAGLGHLTRLAAVERYLDADTLTYTLSAAHSKLGKRAEDIVYYPSADTLQMHPIEWNRGFAQHFDAVLERFQPDVVLFDGTFVYRGVTEASRARGARLVWMQRGCWKAEVDEASEQRHNAIDVCDAVIIPGDYGCPEVVDVGPRIIPHYVNPIVLVKQGDMHSASQAKAQLGLPVEGQYVLIQLGGGSVKDSTDVRDAAVAAVHALGEPWRPVVVRNPLLAPDKQYADGALSVAAYPLARYFAAFEFGVLAGGYNSVQESIALGMPSVFVPNERAVTDDQARRVKTVADSGLGLHAKGVSEVIEAIVSASEPKVRESLLRAAENASAPSGAAEAAEVLLAECRSARASRPGHTFQES